MTNDSADPQASKSIVFYSYIGKPPPAASASACDPPSAPSQPEREQTRTAGLILHLAGRLRAARRDGRAGRPGYDLGRHIVLLRALRTAAAVLRARERTGG